MSFSRRSSRGALSRRMRHALAFVLLMASAMPAAAAPETSPEAGSTKISTLVVYGNDPCPRSKDDDIVVCARQPESERYRIPKELRGKKKEDIVQSWVERAQTLDMVSRKGTPDSCSPIGSGGQTGCMRQFMERARAEREADKAAQE